MPAFISPLFILQMSACKMRAQVAEVSKPGLSYFSCLKAFKLNGLQLIRFTFIFDVRECHTEEKACRASLAFLSHGRGLILYWKAIWYVWYFVIESLSSQGQYDASDADLQAYDIRRWSLFTFVVASFKEPPEGELIDMIFASYFIFDVDAHFQLPMAYTYFIDALKMLGFWRIIIYYIRWILLFDRVFTYIKQEAAIYYWYSSMRLFDARIYFVPSPLPWPLAMYTYEKPPPKRAMAFIYYSTSWWSRWYGNMDDSYFVI